MCRSRSDVKTLQVSQGRRALPGEMQSLCGGHAQTTLVAFRAPSKTGLRLSIGRGRVSQRSGTGAIYLAVAHPSDSRGARSQRNPRQASPVQPIAEARVDVTNVSSRRFAARTLFRIQGKPSSIGGQRDRRTRAVRSFARQGKTARRFISHLLCGNRRGSSRAIASLRASSRCAESQPESKRQDLTSETLDLGNVTSETLTSETTSSVSGTLEAPGLQARSREDFVSGRSFQVEPSASRLHVRLRFDAVDRPRRGDA